MDKISFDRDDRIILEDNRLLQTCESEYRDINEIEEEEQMLRANIEIYKIQIEAENLREDEKKYIKIKYDELKLEHNTLKEKINSLVGNE